MWPQPSRQPAHPCCTTRRSWLCAAAALPWVAHAASAEASIVAPLLNGGTFSSEAQKGRVLLINFWATWCAPCRAEMPELDAYYRAHRDAGFEMLALSVDDPADEARVRDAAKPFSFPVAMMRGAKLTGFGRIWRMPVSAVFDRRGRLVKQDWFVEPKLDAATLDAVIKPLL
jgi:thiol-disulfide isomerase/thioredoxin